MAVIEKVHHRDLEGLRVGRFNIGVNTSFVVYRLGETVFDTGPTNQWKYVKTYLEEKPVKQLFLTHHHEDHAGNTASISELTGVKPQAPILTVEKIRHGYKVPLVQRVVWGALKPANAEPLPSTLQLTTGEPVTAIAAPGHAKDMTCYLLADRGWLFSADLYIANRLMMMRSDEHLPTLLNSIDRVLCYEFDTILCPHRGIVQEGKKKLQEKRDFIKELAQKVQILHQQGDTVSHITTKLLGAETMMTVLSGYNFSKRNLVKGCLEIQS